MNTILAALDRSGSRPVLETALRLGVMADLPVEAVHVGVGTAARAAALVSLFGVPLQTIDGPVEDTLARAVAGPGVRAAALGATVDGEHCSIGPTANHVIAHAGTPIAMVPPQMHPDRAFRRVLLPLEGTEVASRHILERLWPLLVADVEVVVLHVFTEMTRPAMLDRPEYDIALLGREFLARYCPAASWVELRPPPVGAQVADLSRQESIDLVALGWSRDLRRGRARIVREVLEHSKVPVLLLPLDQHQPPRPARWARGREVTLSP